MSRWVWIQCAAACVALAGCKTTESEEPVVDPMASVEFLEPGLRPEVILFPEYLLLEDFQVERHGRVPESELIGGGLRTRLSLSESRTRFTDVLSEQGWAIDKVEIERQSFRLLASSPTEYLELRAVRGTGDTKVFLLYEPNLANPPRVK